MYFYLPAITKSLKNFRQIIAEQREELEVIHRRGWITREQEQYVNPDSRLAQIIMGVRRSGKSTLAHRCLKTSNYAYVNFDDERLAGLNPEDLDQLMEALYAVYGEFSHLLLDEIQNVDTWHLFINRLLRNEIHIVLTGSNSKLLSHELATHLTGRYAKIELFTFSFREYLTSQNIELTSGITAKEKGTLLGAFLKYLYSGGFPDLLTGESNLDYIPTLFDAIVTRDIVFRYNLKYARTFREIALYLASNYATEISYNRLKNTFGLGSENTAKNYVQYLQEAYLVSCLPKFSFKRQETLRYRKVYLIDTAFASISGESHSANSGRLLENLVYLELARNSGRYRYEIFYFKKLVEVDFVIYRDRKVVELIQVAYSVSDQRTLKREIRAMVAAARELNASKLTLITLDEKDEIIENDIVIHMVPIVEWLLNFSI